MVGWISFSFNYNKTKGSHTKHFKTYKILWLNFLLNIRGGGSEVRNMIEILGKAVKFSGVNKGGYWGYLPPPLESWG